MNTTRQNWDTRYITPPYETMKVGGKYWSNDN